MDNINGVLDIVNKQLNERTELSDKELEKFKLFFRELSNSLKIKILEIKLSEFSENELHELTSLKIKLVKGQNFEQAASIRDKERLYIQAVEVLKDLNSIQKPIFKIENNTNLVFYHFGKLDIEKQILRIIKKINQ